MEFAIPVFTKNKKYVSSIIDKPKGRVIADTTEEINRTGEFGGMLKLVAGCIKSITDEQGEEDNNKQVIESIVRNMPIQLVEILALRALTILDNDGVEQVSICPRCKKETIYDGDQALRFEDLEIVEYHEEQLITIDFEEPIVFTSKGNVIETINSITIRFPTLNDGITGSMKLSEKKQLRRQYAIYASALIKVNGEDVDFKFKNLWGMRIFEDMYTTDIEKISKVLSKIGIKKTIHRECTCGREWEDSINLSDFFVSGLQQN